MVIRFCFCSILLCCFVSFGSAQSGHGELRFLKSVGKEIVKEIMPGHASVNQVVTRNENPKVVAAALALLAGPFGAHRIYLGTSEWVPVFYTLTLGGGLGILPLIDLVYILVKKDISLCYQNPRVFMWVNKKTDS